MIHVESNYRTNGEAEYHAAWLALGMVVRLLEQAEAAGVELTPGDQAIVSVGRELVEHCERTLGEAPKGAVGTLIDEVLLVVNKW